MPPTLVVLAALAQAGYLAFLNSDIYFVWGDDYDFLLLRGTINDENVGLLAPHDDHWSTVVVLIYKVLFHFFGMREYYPYGLVTIGFHVLLGLLVYPLMRRLGVGQWTSAAAAVIVLFLGAGAGAVLWSTTMGTVGALLLGYLAIYVGTRFGFSGNALRAVWVILVLALMMSGVGITAVAFVTLFVLSAHGRRAAALVFSVPTAVFVLWYLSYGRDGAKEPLDSAWDYLQMPTYIWTALTHGLERATAIPGSGAVVALVLVVGVLTVRATTAPLLKHLAAAGLLATLFQLTLAASTRLEFGVESFKESRYAYTVVVLLLPAVVLVIDRVLAMVPRPAPLAALLAAWLLVAYVVHGEHLFHQDQKDRTFVTDPWPGIMRGMRAAAQADERVLTQDAIEWPNARFRPDLVVLPEMWDELPEGEATAAERLNAERIFFVGVYRETLGLPSPESWEVELRSGFALARFQDGCGNYTASTDGAELSVEADEGGVEIAVWGPSSSLTTHLERRGEVSSPRSWQVPVGETSFIGTSAEFADLVITFDKAGQYLICS
ncbi:hypothetical protein [Nocardioides houyundeii]|uniref:hypothetical protein n=1 Tax=Nocardioides houyundeii TaxID=2045452 RepID=UPI000DF1359E|nr:hypothetical protein [Nocardioides houyundeii]